MLCWKNNVDFVQKRLFTAKTALAAKVANFFKRIFIFYHQQIILKSVKLPL
jgi:hypothetical protein